MRSSYRSEFLRTHPNANAGMHAGSVVGEYLHQNAMNSNYPEHLPILSASRAEHKRLNVLDRLRTKRTAAPTARLVPVTIPWDIQEPGMPVDRVQAGRYNGPVSNQFMNDRAILVKTVDNPLTLEDIHGSRESRLARHRPARLTCKERQQLTHGPGDIPMIRLFEDSAARPFDSRFVFDSKQ